MANKKKNFIIYNYEDVAVHVFRDVKIIFGIFFFIFKYTNSFDKNVLITYSYN